MKPRVATRVAKPKPALTKNGTLHPDTLLVRRHESGSIAGVGESITDTLGWMDLEEANTSKEIEAAEYRLVKIRTFKLGAEEVTGDGAEE